LKNVNDYGIEFAGYSIFDENYNFEIYKFCSLNCGLKYIVDSKDQKVSENEVFKPTLVKKLKNFFDFYQIDPRTQKCPQALPIERLIVFGGDLDYKTYRKDFICPDIHISSENIIYNSYIDFTNNSEEIDTIYV
jgi:hypothetical protein